MPACLSISLSVYVHIDLCACLRTCLSTCLLRLSILTERKIRNCRNKINCLCSSSFFNALHCTAQLYNVTYCTCQENGFRSSITARDIAVTYPLSDPYTMSDFSVSSRWMILKSVSEVTVANNSAQAQS